MWSKVQKLWGRGDRHENAKPLRDELVLDNRLLRLRAEGLEATADEAGARSAAPESENRGLRAQNEDLRRQIQHLSVPSRAAQIEPTAAAILEIMTTAHRATAETLARATGGPIDEIWFHLGRLLRAELIAAVDSRPDTGSSFEITPAGREWIAARR
jgi:hypothetical protein